MAGSVLRQPLLGHRQDAAQEGSVEADGFGFAQRVSERAQVRTTLEAFVNFPGPAFLEVLIDQNSHVYPMVGPGMGYKDMITGKYITPRQAKVGKIDTTGSF